MSPGREGDRQGRAMCCYLFFLIRSISVSYCGGKWAHVEVRGNALGAGSHLPALWSQGLSVSAVECPPG